MIQRAFLILISKFFPNFFGCFMNPCRAGDPATNRKESSNRDGA